MSMLVHLAAVLVILWIASTYGYNSLLVYIISFIYLFQVNCIYTEKQQRRIRHEERKNASQKLLLSDSETVRWLNHCLEKVWPIFMERVASQEILMSLIPWFLDKFKPWTARKAKIQRLYMGRSPPVITEMRAVSQSVDDDDLVLEMGISFHSAEDMSAVLGVQMRKRLGFGMWANLHVVGMCVEGKVRVGVKFLQEYPFLKRLRVSFQDAPYFQLTVKPIFSHGLDVTELPGIAGWLDNLLAAAFEQSLVVPNMLVVDVERLLSSSPSSHSTPDSPGKWFYVEEKPPIAFVILEILEGAEMKPSDPNGLADPFVKGNLGTYRFKTKIQKKTLNPKWHEEFKIPISNWESSNQLVLNVRDKDRFLDDDLGVCVIPISNLRGGQRHDKWLPLENVKMGMLHIAVRVLDVDTVSKKQDDKQIVDCKSSFQHQDPNLKTEGSPNDSSIHSESDTSVPSADEIDFQDSISSSIWIQHAGNTNILSKTWEPRKGKSSFNDSIKSKECHSYQDSPVSTQSQDPLDELEENSSEEETDMRKGKRRKFRKNLNRLRSMFKKDKEKFNEASNEVGRSSHNERVVGGGEKESGIRLIIDPERLAGLFHHSKKLQDNGNENFDGQKMDADSVAKGNTEVLAKNILEQPTNSTHSLTHLLSRKHSGKDSNASSDEHLNHADLISQDDDILNKKMVNDGDPAQCNQECQGCGHIPTSQFPSNERDSVTFSGFS